MLYASCRNAVIETISDNANNGTVKFDFSKVTATAHALNVGDTIYIDQGGLGLPDRDYYLEDNYKEIRSAYITHIEN